MSKDTIYRQDAIDAVAKLLSDREGGNAVWWKPVAESVIDVLPSAQPDVPDTNVGDMVSRQTAIDAVTDELDMIDHVPRWVFDRLEGRLKQLPSAQPERKKGRITYTHFSEELWGQSAICISCGCKWQIAEEGEDNFCPNCGCKMER